jgi:hypothetical protein
MYGTLLFDIHAYSAAASGGKALMELEHSVTAPAAVPVVARPSSVTHLHTLSAGCYSCFEACCSARPDQLNCACSMGRRGQRWACA